jgi:hypothetical protein
LNTGNVYNLTKLEDFDGDYFSAEASAAGAAYRYHRRTLVRVFAGFDIAEDVV